MDRTPALDLVLAITVLLGDDMRRGLAELGLTQTRSHVLWLVGAGPATQQELATATGLAPRSVTSVVDALVADGLVERRPHPHDRRAVHVTATAAGSDLLTRLARSHAELAEQLFGDLDTEAYEAERAALTRIAGRLEELVAEATS